MNFLVRLRPTGPWRIGPPGGFRETTDLLYRGDALYSAVCTAMSYTGMLDEWLAATAANPDGSAVRFSSLFPFVEGADLITPPRTLWPPAPSAKLRWKSATFVPVSVVESLLAGQALNEETWAIDGPSESLVPSGQNGPFRLATSQNAAVDRLTGTALPHSTAYLEFTPKSGLWCLVSTPDNWVEPIQAAFRWLADSGFGGERNRGWGRSESPIFSEVNGLLATQTDSQEYWLLSPYSPAAADEVAWDRGNYTVLTRGGWISNSSEPKKYVKLIAEGSVLSSAKALQGAAPNVAPEGFAHPVYRAGFAYSIALPAVAIPAATPAATPASMAVSE
jgi:CRISPR type III-A-associated RAMP protein Csm4